jgi:UDP-N-acetylmuramyl pentapeptide synthase
MLTVHVRGIEYEVNLAKAIFEPQVYGILASYACVYHISSTRLEHVSETIIKYQFSENRLQVYVAKNGAVIIEDSYKATPLCTSWYLTMSSKIIAKRKVLIITEMRPLTFDSTNRYTEIAKQSLFAETFLFLGPHKFFKIVHDNNHHVKELLVDEYQSLSKNILNSTGSGDVILLKGSFKYALSGLRSMLV